MREALRRSAGRRRRVCLREREKIRECQASVRAHAHQARDSTDIKANFDVKRPYEPEDTEILLSLA